VTCGSRAINAVPVKKTKTTGLFECRRAGASAHGPWFLFIDHSGVAAELGKADTSPSAGPGLATFVAATLTDLHAALDRVYKLAISLPDAPLERFNAAIAGLPRTTEAERLVIQRIGQDVFRDALLDYWGSRCPLTGIELCRILGDAVD
jgi:hypothetical protein